MAQNREKECFDVQTHYGFGENWASYARHLDETRITQAMSDLARLVTNTVIKGASFLDIGCGSGLHSLAALRLGAAQVRALDFDPDSVATTRAVLEAHAPSNAMFSVQQANILNPSSNHEKSFDVVYSWGVLHHTGNQWQAIRNAASYVRPGGTFVIAIYKKTPYCSFWRLEKKLYTSMPNWLRPVIDYPFSALLLLRLALTGRNPIRYVRDYHQARGMRFMNDIRDWLGGYPYESASAQEIVTFAANLGFVLEESFNTQPSRLGGIFGSTCAEYRFRAAL